MKATKLLGSVALTAALAMGTVPAFAQSTVPGDWEPGVDQGIGGAGVSNTNKMMNVTADNTNSKKIGTGSTAVKASVFDADLQVTVPLQLSVAFASVGSTLTCPSDGTYQIINNGDKAVDITRVTSTAGASFEKVSMTQATTDLTNGSWTTANTGKKGIAMVLDFGNGKTVDLKESEQWTRQTGDGGGYLGSTAVTGTPGNITIAGKSPQGINLSGATTKFESPMSIGYQLATIMTIEYTVEVSTS